MSTQTLLRTTLDAIHAGIAEALHRGAQVVAWQGERCVVDEAVGEAEPGRPMTHDVLMPWMSCTKAVTAVAVAQQVEAGTLELDRPVADVLLDFGQNGKAGITLRHLLTHTGGFRLARYRFPGDPWNTILAHIHAAELERGWVPGQKAGYHLSTSWFVLGELIRVVTGERFADYVKAEVLDPLGMTDCWIGMPHEVYDRQRDRIATVWDTRREPVKALDWTSRPRLTAASPGSTGCGPMHQLVRLYRMLLGGGELDGIRVLQPQTVELFTSTHRAGMFDETFKQVIDFGLGFIRDSKHHGVEALPYGYGRHASPQTFGHSGSQSSVAFADPAHEAAVAVCFNGAPGEVQHNRRIHATLTALYEDLGWSG